MSEINQYSRDLLLDFMDAVHQSITTRLQKEFGRDKWFSSGVEPSIRKEYFANTRKMLQSPIRAVMVDNSQEEEIYGLEHVSNIIEKNWSLFPELSDQKDRTRVILNEITEMRHVTAHQRSHHRIRRESLIRLCQNMHSILRAMDHPESERFEEITQSLSIGGIPWGGER